jgi:urease gamma subunit
MENTTTNATMAVAELAENGADVGTLRQMVQFMAQRLMELDVEGAFGHLEVYGGVLVTVSVPTL